MYVGTGINIFVFDFRLKCFSYVDGFTAFHRDLLVSQFSIKQIFLCNVDSFFYTVFPSCILFVLQCGAISWQLVIYCRLVWWCDKLVPSFTPVVAELCRGLVPD